MVLQLCGHCEAAAPGAAFARTTYGLLAMQLAVSTGTDNCF